MNDNHPFGNQPCPECNHLLESAHYLKSGNLTCVIKGCLCGETPNENRDNQYRQIIAATKRYNNSAMLS